MRRQIEKALATLLVVGVLAGVGAHFYSRIKGDTPPPSFTFNKDKAPGWRGRDSVNVQKVARSSNYTGETPINELPVADMTLFQGESETTNLAENCFVSFSYYDFPLKDVEAAYKNYFGGKHTDAGTLDSFDPIKASIATYEGTKEYEIHQFRFVVDGQDTMQGYQVGFVPLSSGYVRTEGVCKTYEDLTAIKQIMNSVTLLDR